MKNSVSITIVSSRRDPSVTASNKISSTKSAGPYVKRGLDVTFSVLFLLLFMPLFVALILLLVAAQGRPILIAHRRIGKDGNFFSCLKFRTMITNADEILHTHLAVNSNARREWEEAQKLKDDPRVTPVGRVMRRLSIDELPQVINVIRGEMSLVGPRPIVPAEARFYGPDIHLYQSVRPGLTGSWQVGGRSDVSYSRRVQMDVDYVTNWSLRRDLVILAKTVPAVLKARGSC
ncbi:MAG: sugar transferase [Roseiarcus sp.]|uniref:sugar transferase n=1 Tax=Roseiarcus sp. TaxID=1969460 RepID=UPI003C36FBCA